MENFVASWHRSMFLECSDADDFDGAEFHSACEDEVASMDNRIAQLEESILNMKMVGCALMSGVLASDASKILFGEYAVAMHECDEREESQ